ncbi:anhydro-N-acetylmuramic acid kinase [Zymomonas sp.]|uniref:anhydro-N-acetylmuramic acid kinase n=1 Tax=Zymomonas sp. TaxID=2068624 RepID=UPI0025E933A8|nr:anhydro-N-acetylmuramic acid kinase [Zymomonas sp.]MCA1955804.1 anhydro-N-acetylmuramic acid kinase [Zymomonas sp.]
MLAIGLMSGTSLDGVDVALIETNGEKQVKPLNFASYPYSDTDKACLREACRRALMMAAPCFIPEDEVIYQAEHIVTLRHIQAVKDFLKKNALGNQAIKVIGFHGQTIAHRPDLGWTWQIGDGAALAQATKISVVDDFRSHDVQAGGEGAPLLPIYHWALFSEASHPLAVLNLGGIANITWIGSDENDLIACDTGPANGMIDDWVKAKAGLDYDESGLLASKGVVHHDLVDAMMSQKFFSQLPPKSLDRSDFSIEAVAHLSIEDGAATLTAFTAESVARSLSFFPERPSKIIVAGGGRHNITMMKMLHDSLKMPVQPIEDFHLNGDATEAEGFAYLAVRRVFNQPISFPKTTGVPHPMTGGRIHYI